MDASAGITKNNKVPAPPPMPRPGLTVSRATSRLGLGPPHRIPDPWTRPPDDIARGDATVAARNSLLTPIELPTLSPNGARAGLGPDRTLPDSSASGANVATRPDPKLSGPLASRVGDDIGEATQMQRARMMGIGSPPEAPRLSATGARAGLGPLVTGSPGDNARADAMARDLAQSITQLRANARSLLTQASTGIAPVRPLSDASARAGLTGASPSAATSTGFAMRMPKSPVAQDRERWESGTGARILGASKGLGLAKADWGDHATPKPPPKRTWVSVQGDATENPYDAGSCADLAQPPYAAASKSQSVRELVKERVPSDVCPPLRSSVGILESILSRDARMAAIAPVKLLRRWASRPVLLHGDSGRFPSGFAKPHANAAKQAHVRNDCGCSGCGCKSGATMNGASAPAASSRKDDTRKRSERSGTPSTRLRWEVRPLVESFAVRHGRDSNAEWFVPIFRRTGRLVFGTEQQGPSSHAWQPDPTLGMKPGDALAATIHTHSRSAQFSDDDRAAGAALGVPMVLVAPGAERARLYDSESHAVEDLPALGIHTNRIAPDFWKPSGAFARPTTNVGSTAPAQGGAPFRDSKESPRTTIHAPRKRITISAPPLPAGGSSAAIPAYLATNALQMNWAVATSPKQPLLIDEDVLRRTVQLAADNPDASAELIWLQLTSEAASGKFRVTVIPDPDLFRAIVGVAQRDSPASRDAPDTVLDVAKQEPLYVEPALLDSIIKFAQQAPTAPFIDVWISAWASRLALAGDPQSPVAYGSDFEVIGPDPPAASGALTEARVPTGDLSWTIWRAKPAPKFVAHTVQTLPTPPNAVLLQAIVDSARFVKTFSFALPNADSRAILSLAHEAVRQLNATEDTTWPRYVSTDLLNWIVFFAAWSKEAQSSPDLLNAALFMVKVSGAPFPPEPQPGKDLLDRIASTAWEYQGSHPLDILHRALADRLTDELRPRGIQGFRCNDSDACTDGSVCNWAGICEPNLWPPLTAYTSNITIPGDSMWHDWTVDVQGLTTDGTHWFVVSGGDGGSRIYKVPFDVNWNSDWEDDYGVVSSDMIGDVFSLNPHWGDPDVYDGRVYVPMETPTASRETSQLGIFDANTLEFLGVLFTGTDHAASVAINRRPIPAELVMEDTYYGPGMLFVFPVPTRGSVIGVGPASLGQPLRQIELEPCQDGKVVTKIQGIAFSPDGNLYISSDQDPDGGIFAFQLGPHKAECIHYLPIEFHHDKKEELEGLTVFDSSWGQIHTFVFQNQTPFSHWNTYVWFKHIAVNGAV